MLLFAYWRICYNTEEYNPNPYSETKIFSLINEAMDAQTDTHHRMITEWKWVKPREIREKGDTENGASITLTQQEIEN